MCLGLSVIFLFAYCCATSIELDRKPAQQEEKEKNYLEQCVLSTQFCCFCDFFTCCRGTCTLNLFIWKRKFTKKANSHPKTSFKLTYSQRELLRCSTISLWLRHNTTNLFKFLLRIAKTSRRNSFWMFVRGLQRKLIKTNKNGVQNVWWRVVARKREWRRWS